MNLIRIGIEDARKLWQMQTEAFQDLYKKYQDTETALRLKILIKPL